jgi:CRISPR-associated protein Csb2
MARVQAVVGERERLASFFSGHEEDGSPLGRSGASHLAFAFEAVSRHLLVLAPHLIERRTPTDKEREHLRNLDIALEGFRELRAGSSGRLAISPSVIGHARNDLLFGHSRVWETTTPYVVTRHVKGVGAVEALAADVRAECRRLGLAEPSVEPRDVRGVPGTGLVGHVRLTFRKVVSGPILLGRTRYFGGGLFRPV